MQQRGILQHAERPLVWAGDKGNPGVGQDTEPLTAGTVREFTGRRFLGGDNRPLAQVLAEEARPRQPLRLFGGFLADGAVDASARMKDAGVAIAKGPRIAYTLVRVSHGGVTMASGCRIWNECSRRDGANRP